MTSSMRFKILDATILYYYVGKSSIINRVPSRSGQCRKGTESIGMGLDLERALASLSSRARLYKKGIIVLIDLANLINRLIQYDINVEDGLCEITLKLKDLIGSYGNIIVIYNSKNSHIPFLNEAINVLTKASESKNDSSFIRLIDLDNTDEVDSVDELLIKIIDEESRKGNFVLVFSNDNLGAVRIRGEVSIPYHNIRLSKLEDKVMILPHKMLKKVIADCSEYPPFTWPEWAVDAIKNDVCGGRLGVKRRVTTINGRKRFYTVLDTRRALKGLLREYGLVAKRIGVIRSGDQNSMYHIVILKLLPNRVKIVDLSEGRVFEVNDLSPLLVEQAFIDIDNDVRGLSVIHPESHSKVRELVEVENDDREVYCLLVPARCHRDGEGVRCVLEKGIVEDLKEALRSRQVRPPRRRRRALS